MQHLRNWRFILLAGLTLTIASVARGGGIEVPMQDSKAAAEADAFTAQADDPSAIFYNPAGLTQLHGTQISAGLYYLQPEFHYQNDMGESERMSLPSLLPHVYVESDLNTSNWRVGLGVNDVFGINEDWGASGPLRQLVDNAQLMVIDIAPTLAYRINEHLSLGLAVDIYYGNVYLTRNVVVAAPPVPEGEFHYRGDAWSVGATPSLLYTINPDNSVGLYYKSPFTLNFNGSAKVSLDGLPVVGPSPTNAILDLPQSIGAGYAWKGLHNLTVEGDLIWTDWHSVRQLAFASDNPAFNGQNLPANWMSGFTYRLGAQYQLTQHWAIRGGYAFGQNAAPEDTFSPIVPDSNYHLFAVGVGYSANHWAVDLATNFIYRERRHIINVNDPLVDGTWDNMMYGIMLTFTAKL